MLDYFDIYNKLISCFNVRSYYGTDEFYIRVNESLENYYSLFDQDSLFSEPAEKSMIRQYILIGYLYFLWRTHKEHNGTGTFNDMLKYCKFN